MTDAATPPATPVVSLRHASRLRDLRIGLLGGAFNPPHEGHLRLSKVALRRFHLHEIWWIPSVIHPFKPEIAAVSLDNRLDAAKRLLAGKRLRIRLAPLENELRLHTTQALLSALVKRCPHTRFIWLIGGDNLIQLHRWRRWAEILDVAPIAALLRGPTALRLKPSPIALRFPQRRRPPASPNLQRRRLPYPWSIMTDPGDSSSSTAIRMQRIDRPAASGDIDVSDCDDSAQLSARIGAWLDREKAGDIVAIRLADFADFADFMLIATAMSPRHAKTLGERLQRQLKPVCAPRIEGLTAGDWIVIDAGSVVIHIFLEEARKFYNLEKLWSLPSPSRRHETNAESEKKA